MTSVTPGRRPPTPSHAGEGENIVTGDIPLPPELGDHATDALDRLGQAFDRLVREDNADMADRRRGGFVRVSQVGLRRPRF